MTTSDERDRLIHILVVHFDMFRDKAEEAADLFLHDKALSRRAANSAGGVEVKALEWESNSPSSIWTGELIFGVYYAIYDEGTGWRVFRHQFLSEASETEVAYVASADEAKAAAQADFNQRILSAIVSSPVSAEVTEEMVETVAMTMHDHRKATDSLWTLWEDMPEDYRQTSLAMVRAGLTALNGGRENG